MCGCYRSSWNGVRSSAHTVNIWNMFSTLVVSKLSGWLNDVASCRVRGGVLKLLSHGGDLCAKCEPGGGQGRCTQSVCAGSKPQTSPPCL